MSVEPMKSNDSIQDDLLLHYWLFGSDNVSNDVNDYFLHKEIESTTNNINNLFISHTHSNTHNHTQSNYNINNNNFKHSLNNVSGPAAATVPTVAAPAVPEYGAMTVAGDAPILGINSFGGVTNITNIPNVGNVTRGVTGIAGVTNVAGTLGADTVTATGSTVSVSHGAVTIGATMTTTLSGHCSVTDSTSYVASENTESIDSISQTMSPNANASTRDLINFINNKPSLQTILAENDNDSIKWTCKKSILKTCMVRAFCESKEGSRYLQTILEQSNEDTVKTFLNKIWLFAHKLCVNTAGHYVIMKLLGICQSKVALIALYFKFIDEIICSNLTNMINNIYSAQIISYSLHCNNVNIQNYALYQISYTLTKYGTTLIHNASTNVCGNRIIQSVIEKSVFNCNLPKKPIGIIKDYVVNNVLMLCNHQYACRVVQAIIKCHDINRECINQLLYYLPKVCNNANGNYSIQMCLEYSTLSKRSDFIEEIFFGQNSEVVDYSKQGKYTLPAKDSVESIELAAGTSIISNASHSSSSSEFEDDNNIINNNNNESMDSKIYIKPNYEKFLFGQYSSHVCDKAFQLASMSQKMRLIKCLICCNNINGNGNGTTCKSQLQRVNACVSDDDTDLTNTVMYKLMHHQFGNYVVRNILYHLLKLNNGNGKYLRRIVFNYLLKLQRRLILSQREISFTYAKHILDMIDRHAM